MKSLFAVLAVAVLAGFLVFRLGGGTVENQKINLENYAKIEPGMNLEWVQDILGPPTRVAQQIQIGDRLMGTYMWHDTKGDAFYIIATENGVVKEKSPPIPRKEYLLGERGVGVRTPAK